MVCVILFVILEEKNMKIFSLISLFILFTIFVNVTFSQFDAWDNYTSGGQVQSICEDGSNIWVSSWGGIAKIRKSDGYTEFFNRGNSSMLNIYIKDLDIADDGAVWLVSEASGVVKFYNNEWTNYIEDNSEVPTNIFSKVRCDSNGGVWFLADDYSGLVYFDGEDWSIFNTQNSEIATNLLTSIDIDENGNIWIGTNSGVCKFNGIDWTTYNTSNSNLVSNSISDLYVDENNTVWVGLGTEGVAKFTGDLWVNYYPDELGLSFISIESIFAKDDVLYCLSNTLDGGLLIFEEGEWTIFNSENSDLPNLLRSDVILDNEDNIWIGTTQSGVVEYSNEIVEIHEVSNSKFVSNVILGIDSGFDDSHIWIADYGNYTVGSGLMHIVNNTLNFYSLTNQIPNCPPNESLYWCKVQNDSIVWVGFNSGIGKFCNDNWTFYNTSNSDIPNGHMHDCDFDSDGNLWLGSEYDGLVKFDGENWMTYNTQNSGILGDFVVTILIDEINTVWFGLYEGGIMSYDGQSWELFDTFNSGLSSNIVYELRLDNDGVLWAGTDNGVARYNGTDWESFNTSNSDIPCSRIITIDFDTENNLWCGGPNEIGMASFNGEEWIGYDIYNSNLPCNHVRSILCDYKGQVWVGTDLGGLGVYNPLVNSYQDLLSEFKSQSVYPNPTNGKIYLDLNVDLFPILLEIYDVNGKFLESINTDINRTIDLNYLQSGLYIYKIIDTDGQAIEEGKLIIN